MHTTLVQPKRPTGRSMPTIPRSVWGGQACRVVDPIPAAAAVPRARGVCACERRVFEYNYLEQIAFKRRAKRPVSCLGCRYAQWVMSLCSLCPHTTTGTAKNRQVENRIMVPQTVMWPFLAEAQHRPCASLAHIMTRPAPAVCPLYSVPVAKLMWARPL